MTGRPDIVGGHYHVQKKIGEGSFGVIYQGYNDLNEKLVAIKFEPIKSAAPQLKDEYRTYRLLMGCAGIPSVYYFGVEGNFNCLVMELLGPSLEEVFDKCGRKFSVGTVCYLAIEMISRIQTIHEKFLIYRDIKPDNFLLGTKSPIVYIVDFGMAKHYWNPLTQTHIPYSEKKSLSGTARYMSINTHRGREQSRRDDLEAIGHVLLYFLRGSLPWQGIRANTNKEKYELIGLRKQKVLIDELCAGFPEEFARYMEYVRSLGFEEKPKYETLKGLFRGLLAKLGNDGAVLDWDKLGVVVTCSSTATCKQPVPLKSPGQQPRKLEPIDQSSDGAGEIRSGLQASPRSPREKSPVTSVNHEASRKPDTLTPAPKSPLVPDAAAAINGENAAETPTALLTQSSAPAPIEEKQGKKQGIWRRLFCL